MKSKIRNKIFFLSAVFYSSCSGSFLLAQPAADDQLAAQYLQNKEYDKAVVYYEKLFNRHDRQVYYNPYLLCLLKMREHSKAEKLIKKMIKYYPGELKYLVDLGVLYADLEKNAEAKKQYEKAIKLLSGNQQQILNLANAFLEAKEWDYAISTYRKGKNLLRGFYPFAAEIAAAYELKGDLFGMVNEYLSLLEEDETQIQTVQNGLQPSFDEEKNETKNEIIRTELLKKVQAYPDKTIFAEMLIWFFIQEKKFDAAFVQAKALDKRLNEGGERIMSLGQMCLTNQDYDAATKCFRYVVEKGAENYHYINARMELLNALHLKIISRFSYTQNDLTELEKNYIQTLNELGKHAGTVLLLKNFAHLQAFYLDKVNEGATLLEEALKIQGVNEKTISECKLELGDILLLKDEIWEASLLYSQVELAFKHEVLGQEAKFRNAKLSFYNGEFKWAKAQLDVLKASTSKLIANDAMELSLLISDNYKTSDDSLALAWLSRAELLSFRNQNQKALALFDSVITRFPSTTLADDILYRKYKIKMKEKKFSDAAFCLQKILDDYSWDVLADDALFYLAELNELYLNQPERALKLYGDLILQYPGSLYTVEARKRFRKLRGDNVN